jgi:undecaprenyl-diphosphatase
MTLLQSIILGIVQGITEFLPVSSSAHLLLTKSFLGIREPNLYFDLLCHTGTLLALILFLRTDIFTVLRDKRACLLYALALIPLVPAYFLMKPLRIAASNPAYLGYFLLFTSILLFLASRKSAIKTHPLKIKDVVCIGIMQTMALLPGISRSGSTIATGRLLGLDWLSAARFSFLLSIPAILGGQALETLKLLNGSSPPLSLPCCAAGFLTSFAVGLLGVRLMFFIYEKEIVRPFAFYLLAAGLFALWALHG